MSDENPTGQTGKRRKPSFTRAKTGRFDDVISPVPPMPPPPGDEFLPGRKTPTEFGQGATTPQNLYDSPPQARTGSRSGVLERPRVAPLPSVTEGAEESDSLPDTPAMIFRRTDAEKRSWWERQSTAVRFLMIVIPAVMVIYFLALTYILINSAVAPKVALPADAQGTPLPTNTLPVYIIKPTLPPQQAPIPTATRAGLPTVTPLPTATLLPTPAPTTAPPVTVIVPPTAATRPVSTPTRGTSPAATVTTAPAVSPTSAVPPTVPPASPTAAATTVPATSVPATSPAASPTSNSVTTAPATSPTATPTINAVTIAPTVR